METLIWRPRHRENPAPFPNQRFCPFYCCEEIIFSAFLPHSTYSVPISKFPISTTQLAPSPRVLEFLIRRGRIPSTSMALVVVAQGMEAAIERKPMVDPPTVVTTPCDPWPRPYFLENGLRRVAPYHFTYNTFCKERWRGRELLDIFASEFRDRPQEYYVSHLDMLRVRGSLLKRSNRLIRVRKPERCDRTRRCCG